ncbi:MAG: integration host factor subunit alpha [Rhodobacteraceae bacterium]|nr:integration host factor subunit alpha [Paracoccaceae bacterium]MCY4195331.1 integration host factor subunit alpha [Paracoccaceae bacterium]
MRKRRSAVRADLAEAVHQAVGLPNSECSEIVKDVLDTISNSLSAGESVKISSFGSFGVRHKRARPGRNPRTGEDAVVEPRRVVTFRASHELKRRVLMAHQRD